MDQHWHVVERNRGLAPQIINLPEWSAYLIGRLCRQIATTADPFLSDLAREVSQYPGAGREREDEPWPSSCSKPSTPPTRPPPTPSGRYPARRLTGRRRRRPRGLGVRAPLPQPARASA